MKKDEKRKNGRQHSLQIIQAAPAAGPYRGYNRGRQYARRLLSDSNAADGYTVSGLEEYRGNSVL
ncbi:hypothetical protein JCM30204_49580 [Dysgonomonas termitidis]